MTLKKVVVALVALAALGTLLHLTAGMADATTPYYCGTPTSMKPNGNGDLKPTYKGKFCTATSSTSVDTSTSTSTTEAPSTTTMPATTTTVTDPPASHDEGVAPVAVRTTPSYTG